MLLLLRDILYCHFTFEPIILIFDPSFNYILNLYDYMIRNICLPLSLQINVTL